MSLNLDKQHTIKSSIAIEGIGLQTNQKSSIRIEPSDVNSGIVFIREDLAQNNRIEANCDNVLSIVRCTTIGNGQGVKVSTIEHLMAALVGCGVDNVVIYVKGEEIPIMDGSSAVFVSEIEKVGVQEQNAPKIWYDILEPIKVVDEATQAEIVVIPSDRYQISTFVSLDKTPRAPLLSARLNNISHFAQEIAHARTFCFYTEIEQLLKAGLIKGGNTENAVVIFDNEEGKQEPYFKGKHFEETPNIVTHTPLRYHNEPARHKLLDVLGDLALVGLPFKGHVICTKPGHKINIQLAQKIRQHLLPPENTFNTNLWASKENFISFEKIKQYLPHRYPFLLIDKVLHIDNQQIIAVKNATANEQFFEGHFPQKPIMPGVLVIEAMAQAGGIFLLYHREAKGWIDSDITPYFLKIDKCRFKRLIVPGDVLYFKMNVVYQNQQRGLMEMVGRCFVNSQLCCEAFLVAQMIHNKPS